MPFTDQFDEIWCCDFEFTQLPGERPEPICMVATEFKSGTTMRLWIDELCDCVTPPFRTDARVCFVAYAAAAEISCFLQLGWRVPRCIVDLYAEFRCLTNGRTLVHGSGLLGALSYFGQDAMDSAEKESMRALAIRGGPYSDEERRALLDYCESDVRALETLLDHLGDRFRLDHALIRGRYSAAVAVMEYVGVPIDRDMYQALTWNWPHIRAGLLTQFDQHHLWQDGSFKLARFEAFLIANDIWWPRTPAGRLSTKAETFEEMADDYPILKPIHDLHYTLEQFSLGALELGSDWRNRTALMPFRTKTGRNAPSTTKFVFGPARWIRGLVKPEPGMALAYCDFSQQELGIAAAFSRDPLLRQAYESGDPYLAFAVESGMAPAGATKKTHPEARSLAKGCVLGVGYGMSEIGLAKKIQRPVVHARDILRRHRSTYRRFWEWSDAAANHAAIHGHMTSVLGWRWAAPEKAERTARNFPMQSAGADMLRVAVIRALEAGVRVAAPVHDAILIEAPVADIDDAVAATRAAMVQASRDLLGDLELRVDAEIIRYPDRYMDERGQAMWDTAMRHLRQVVTVQGSGGYPV